MVFFRFGNTVAWANKVVTLHPGFLPHVIKAMGELQLARH